MKYYHQCPLCHSKPFLNLNGKINLDGNGPLDKIEIDEFLRKVAKEEKPKDILSVCIKCRILYRGRFFDEKEVEKIYNQVYYQMNKRISQIKGFVYSDAVFRRKYARQIYNEVKDAEKLYQTKIVDIYDIGGYDGFVMKDLAEEDYRCTVFDPIANPSCSQRISKKNIWSFQIKDNQAADLVLSCDVLAHCLDPKRELDTYYRLLKKGGFLYLRVPYELWSVFSWFLFKKWRGRNLGVDLTHFIFFSSKSLTDLLKSSGFKCVKVRFDEFPKINMIILARKLDSKGERSLRTFLLSFPLSRSGYWVMFLKKLFIKLFRFFRS